MWTRTLRFLGIGVIIAFLAQPDYGSIVAAKDRADDKRLETRVTISAPLIPFHGACRANIRSRMHS